MSNIDLHSHLHGCIKIETIEKLLSKEDLTENVQDKICEAKSYSSGSMDLDTVFKWFSITHLAISSLSKLKIIVSEAIDSYVQDNVN